MTEWLQNEFQNNTETRIGADPTLIPAQTWQLWEENLGNETNEK